MAETVTAEAPATNGEAKKRKRLPEIDHVFKAKADLEKTIPAAKAKGYQDYALRKFEVKIHGVTLFVLAYNSQDAYGRACESGHLGTNATCVEHDAKSGGKAPATVDGVVAALAGFSEEDRNRIKAALAAKK